MITEHKPLLNSMKIVVKAAGNSQHGTFSSSVMLDQKNKILIENTYHSEHCLKMIVEHRTLLNLTKIFLKLQEIARTALFYQVSCWTK